MSRPVLLPPALNRHLTEDSAYLLPDENPEAFRELRDALIEELSPATPYLLRLVMNLVQIEWEMDRHRRMLAQTLAGDVSRAIATLEVPASAPVSASRTSYLRELEDIKQRAQGNGPRLDLFSTTGRNEAEVTLSRIGSSLSEKLADAYGRNSDQVGYHEARIADLERRRRAVRADYDALKARASVETKTVIDSEVIQ